MTAQEANIAATTDLAMRAVARHMLDHDLTVSSIAAPRTVLGETSVIVHVPTADSLDGSGDDGGYWVSRWADTIHADTKSTDPITYPGVPFGAFERYVVHGRLPDSGVRVSVVTVRMVVSPVVRRGLVSVPSGGAA